MSRYPLRNRPRSCSPPRSNKSTETQHSDLPRAIDELAELTRKAHALVQKMTQNKAKIPQAWFRSTPDHPAFFSPSHIDRLTVGGFICCFLLAIKWLVPILDECCTNPAYQRTLDAYSSAFVVSVFLTFMSLFIVAQLSGASDSSRSLKQQVEAIVERTESECEQLIKSSEHIVRWIADEFVPDQLKNLDRIREDYDRCFH